MRNLWNSLQLLRQLLLSLLKFKTKLTLCTFALITLRSMSAGMTFLMILPLLEFAGVSGSTPAKHTHSSFYALFDFFHIPKTLFAMLILFALVMCLTACIAYLEQHSSIVLQQRYNQYLRTHLQRSLLCSHWSFLSSQKKSDLIHVLIAETHNLAICNHQLLLLINQIFLIAMNTVIAFYLSWSMTLFAIGTAALLFSFMFPLHRKTLKAGAEHLKTNQALHQVISQQLYCIKTIKGSGVEISSVNAFEKTGKKLEKLSTEFNLAIARNRLRYGISSAIIFSLLLYLAIQVFVIPFQQLIILLIIYARILPLISNAQQMYQRILHQIPAYENITQLLNKAQAHQELIDASQTILFKQEINVQNVSFKYPQVNRWIIRNMSFQLKKNTSTLLLGPSGVGKTTLIDLVCGLSEPAEGKIYIDEIAITSKNAHAWRTQIAYITQDIFLFNASVRDNLFWFNHDGTEEELHEAIKLAGADFIYYLPQGLDTLIGENGVTLSGGERQRIAFARAIIQKPKLLILDESTNSLDPERVLHVQNSLVALKGKMTVLMISHQKIDRNIVDQVIELTELSEMTSSHLEDEICT